MDVRVWVAHVAAGAKRTLRVQNIDNKDMPAGLVTHHTIQHFLNDYAFLATGFPKIFRYGAWSARPNCIVCTVDS